MKTYHKPRPLTFKDATRKVLRGHAARDRAEQRIGSFKREAANIAKTIRTRLVDENPSASNVEIDAELERIMRAGMCPTQDKVPEPRGIPKDVQADRKAERRPQVQKGRTSRQRTDRTSPRR